MSYGFNYPHGFERKHIYFYERHISNVIEFFTQNNADHMLKVLCWENGDDWESLCSFLDKPYPKVGFPHSNKMTKQKIIDSEYYENNVTRVREQLQLLGMDFLKNIIVI